MKKKRSQAIVTKKHKAIARRERTQMKWILTGTVTVAVIVIGLLAFGYLDSRVLQGRRPIATINGEEIITSRFRARVRLLQMDLNNRIQSHLELITYLGEEQEFSASLRQQADQMIAQLNSPLYMGQLALNQLIEETLVRQELERRGISVDEEQIDLFIAAFFGYYPEGTPTSLPTSTPDPTTLAQIEPSPTSTEEGAATSVPTITPAPTSTPYTGEAYAADMVSLYERLRDVDIEEEDFRDRFRGVLARELLMEEMQEFVPREVDQVWLRQIVLEDPETVDEVLQRIEQGDAWEDLAAEYAQDLLAGPDGGDIGWMTQEDLVASYGSDFAQPAFDTATGEIFGPIETSLGWVVAEVLGHEVRYLDDQDYGRSVDLALSAWLEDAKATSEIVVVEDWLSRVPEPSS